MQQQDDAPRGKAKVAGAHSGGLIFSGGGLTPRQHHPGQESAPHPHIAARARQQQEHPGAFRHNYTNQPQLPSSQQYGGAPLHGGRRHVDPQHVDVSDGTKLEEGRLGKAMLPAGQQQQRGHLLVGSNTPAAGVGASASVAMGGTRRPIHGGASNTPRYGATSVQCSEAILRRMLKDPDPVYREAARHALQEHHGSEEVVLVEKKLTHHKAAKQFAEESAARRAEDVAREQLTRMKKEERVVSDEYVPLQAAGHPATTRTGTTTTTTSAAEERLARPFGAAPAPHQLGKMDARLAQSTPFALDACPSQQATASAGDDHYTPRPTGRAHTKPLYHYQNNFSSIQFANYRSPETLEKEQERVKNVPAPFTTAPYDSTAVSPYGSYPAPPPVGLQQGLRDKPFMVQHSKHHNQTRMTPDQDTLNQRRADHIREQHQIDVKPQTTSVGGTVICGSGMIGCHENHSEYNQRYNPASTTPRRATSTPAGRMEAKCHAREEEALQKHTGKAAHRYKKTALW